MQYPKSVITKLRRHTIFLPPQPHCCSCPPFPISGGSTGAGHVTCRLGVRPAPPAYTARLGGLGAPNSPTSYGLRAALRPPRPPPGAYKCVDAPRQTPRVESQFAGVIVTAAGGTRWGRLPPTLPYRTLFSAALQLHPSTQHILLLLLQCLPLLLH